MNRIFVNFTSELIRTTFCLPFNFILLRRLPQIENVIPKGLKIQNIWLPRIPNKNVLFGIKAKAKMNGFPALRLPDLSRN